MKRNTWFVIGGIVLLMVLGGAAYMGGRLLSGKTPSAAGGGIGLSLGGGKGGKSVTSIEAKPALELPQMDPDAEGVFDHAADRSIFVKTGMVTLMMNKNGETASSSDGPTVEVVVNQDTKIFKDTTEFPDAPSGSIVVQQTVAEGSIDEIGENSHVTAWGKRTGDRIVAEVLVYGQPPVMNKR